MMQENNKSNEMFITHKTMSNLHPNVKSGD